MVYKTFIKTFLVSSIALAFVPATHADVIKVTDAATLQQQNAAKYFSQRGISGEKAVPLETAGTDRTLALALKMIVPDSWVIKPSGNFEQALVSWKGGISWPIILRNMAESEGIYISLDWIEKSVTVNVPGSTQSEANIAAASEDMLAEERMAFRKKQRDEWSKRSDIERELSTERNQLASLVERQRESQIANQEFIARLNESNDKLESRNRTLQESLEMERQKNQELIDRFSVIDPSLGPQKEVDATELFGDYQNRWVLPFDRSFEYFIKGGHADLIETHTPATFIAKSGSVRYVLEQWAEHVGWEVEYNAKVNHENPYEVDFKGSFIESSKQLIKIFEKSDRPLDIQFYPDVRVTRKDGSVRKGLAVVSDYNYRR